MDKFGINKYKNKYLKYKNKYINLKNNFYIKGGSESKSDDGVESKSDDENVSDVSELDVNTGRESTASAVSAASAESAASAVSAVSAGHELYNESDDASEYNYEDMAFKDIVPTINRILSKKTRQMIKEYILNHNEDNLRLEFDFQYFEISCEFSFTYDQTSRRNNLIGYEWTIKQFTFKPVCMIIRDDQNEGQNKYVKLIDGQLFDIDYGIHSVLTDVSLDLNKIDGIKTGALERIEYSGDWEAYSYQRSNEIQILERQSCFAKLMKLLGKYKSKGDELPLYIRCGFEYNSKIYEVEVLKDTAQNWHIYIYIEEKILCRYEASMRGMRDMRDMPNVQSLQINLPNLKNILTNIIAMR